MRYFRAATLFALCAAFVAFAAWWTLNVVPRTLARFPDLRDGTDIQTLSLQLGVAFVAALPALFASLCWHGARRQLRGQGRPPNSRSDTL